MLAAKAGHLLHTAPEFSSPSTGPTGEWGGGGNHRKNSAEAWGPHLVAQLSQFHVSPSTVPSMCNGERCPILPHHRADPLSNPRSLWTTLTASLTHIYGI